MIYPFAFLPRWTRQRVRNDGCWPATADPADPVAVNNSEVLPLATGDVQPGARIGTRKGRPGTQILDFESEVSALDAEWLRAGAGIVDGIPSFLKRSSDNVAPFVRNQSTFRVTAASDSISNSTSVSSRA